MAVSSPLSPASLRPSPLDLGGLIGNSFAVFGRGFGLFLVLGLLPNLFVGAVAIAAAVVIVVSVAGLTYGQQAGGGLVLGVILLAVAALASALIQAKFIAMAVLAADSLQTRGTADFAGVRNESRGVMGRLLGVYLLAGVVVAVAALAVVAGVLGTLASVGYTGPSSRGDQVALQALLGFLVVVVLGSIAIAVAVMVLTVRLLAFMPAVAIERLTGMAAIRRSWQLTSGAFWRILGTYLLVSLGVSIVSGSLSMLTQGFMTPLLNSVERDGAVDPSVVGAALIPAMIGSTLLQIAIQTLVTPFLAVLSTVIYRDQVRRRELPQGAWTGAAPYPAAAPYSAPAPSAPWGAQPFVTPYPPAPYPPAPYASSPQAPAQQTPPPWGGTPQAWPGQEPASGTDPYARGSWPQEPDRRP